MKVLQRDFVYRMDLSVTFITLKGFFLKFDCVFPFLLNFTVLTVLGKPWGGNLPKVISKSLTENLC